MIMYPGGKAACQKKAEIFNLRHPSCLFTAGRNEERVGVEKVNIKSSTDTALMELPFDVVTQAPASYCMISLFKSSSTTLNIYISRNYLHCSTLQCNPFQSLNLIKCSS